MGWSKTVTLFRADHGRAPVLLQLRHPLSTWDGQTRSPPDPVFPGQGAYLNYSTIVELRGLEPLTLTLPVWFGQCLRPAETENRHASPGAVTALECRSVQLAIGSTHVPAPVLLQSVQHERPTPAEHALYKCMLRLDTEVNRQASVIKRSRIA